MPHTLNIVLGKLRVTTPYMLGHAETKII